MRRTRPSSTASSIDRAAGLPWGWLWLVLCCACRPSSESFYDKLYYCDSEVTSGNCGTDRNGKPMMCFAARQLGAQDFCAQTCGVDQVSAPEGDVCLSSGAKLASCQPSRDLATADDGGASPSRACADRALRCLRTDLLQDEGVCTTVDLCTSNADCTSPVRKFCASTLLAALYGTGTGFSTDHLFCVQAGCLQANTLCPPGESCLPTVVHAQSLPPDICVPNCDSNLNCPPNYFCYRKVSGPAAAAVCIPGLLGFRCTDRNDCLVGDCQDTGAGFNICTLPCSSDDECTRFDGFRSIMFCSSLTPGAPPMCTTASAFQGSACLTDADCNAPELCTYYSPYNTQLDLGTCLLPCDSSAACPLRGGLRHTCLDFLDRPVCYPGDFGLYCRTDADCFPGLSCLPVTDVDASDAVTTGPRCTATCAVDQDCKANPVARFGWCSDGLCAPNRSGNRLCDRAAQCQSGACQVSTLPADQGSGTKRCTFQPGGG